MDRENPFPRDAIRRASPLAWRYSEALARATSLDAGCEYTYNLLLVADTLNALQVKYGGILVKFPNLIVAIEKTSRYHRTL